jgi:hypothetical protein
MPATAYAARLGSVGSVAQSNRIHLARRATQAPPPPPPPATPAPDSEHHVQNMCAGGCKRRYETMAVSAMPNICEGGCRLVVWRAPPTAVVLAVFRALLAAFSSLRPYARQRRYQHSYSNRRMVYSSTADLVLVVYRVPVGLPTAQR